VIGADAVDPGIDFIRVDVKPGLERRVRLGDHCRFPGGPALAVGVGLWRGRLADARDNVSMGCKVVLLPSDCQSRSRHWLAPAGWITAGIRV
jgi:hypothetical protein